MTLYGAKDSAELTYQIPAGASNADQSLLIDYEASNLLIAPSSLTIAIDDEPVKSIKLDGSSKRKTVKLNLSKSQSAQGYHNVSLRFYGVLKEGVCVRQDTSGNWIKIYPDSRLVLSEASKSKGADLGHFPYPFAQSGNTGEETDIILPDKPTSAEAEAAVKTEAFLKTADSRLKVSYVKESDAGKISNPSIVIGADQHWNGKIKELFEQGNIKAEDNKLLLAERVLTSGDKRQPVLFVTAQSDKTLADKIRVITDSAYSAQLGGDTLTIGRHTVYYFIQGVTSLILVLAANTGFSAFPQLAFNLARDQYMPRMFTVRGDRLGFSNGIIFLGIASILLILLFGGRTEHLIPLYAVGVFIPFTLSQTGMCIKWIRQKPKGWAVKMLINSCGAAISFMVLCILFATKFNLVWPVLLFMPAVVMLFFVIKNHYTAVGEQLRVVDQQPEEIRGTVVIVPVAGVTTVVQKSIQYAKSLSDQVIAVHVSFDRENEKKVEKRWEELHNGVRLVTLHSSYRSLVHPFDKFLETVEQKAKKEQFSVMVLFPQFITKKRWQTILHNQSAFLLRVRLFWKKDIIVATLPYHFKK